MGVQPVVTNLNLNWGNNPGERLSGKTYVDPRYGTTIDCRSVTVSLQFSTHIQQFYATAVEEGLNYGFVNDVLVDIAGTNPTGTLITAWTNKAASTEYSFVIDASTHLSGGPNQDIVYRIGLYAQQDDGTWNYEYFFIPVGNDYFQLNNGDILQVPVIT